MALSVVRVDSNPSAVPEYGLFIGGKWHTRPAALVDDFNPATGTLYARVAQATREDARASVSAAHDPHLPALQFQRTAISLA